MNGWANDSRSEGVYADMLTARSMTVFRRHLNCWRSYSFGLASLTFRDV